MNEIKKLCAEDDSSFGRLPEEIVFQILDKLIDLKTLCLCKLVSKRFRLIVAQVENISFTVSTYPLVDTPNLGSYGSAIGSLKTFQCVKSLRIQLPSSYDNHSLFKWKFNFRIRPDSLIFLSPSSICNNKESNVNESSQEVEEEQDWELTKKKADIMVECLKDAMTRFVMLIRIIRLPLLENVSITDTGKRGKVSLSVEKIDDLYDWLSSFSLDNIEQKLEYFSSHCTTKCYVPLLNLPVSGYVMKGVYLILVEWNDLSHDNNNNNNSLMMNDDDDGGDFEDKEESTYSEAVTEIFKKHSDRIERLHSHPVD